MIYWVSLSCLNSVVCEVDYPYLPSAAEAHEIFSSVSWPWFFLPWWIRCINNRQSCYYSGISNLKWWKCNTLSRMRNFKKRGIKGLLRMVEWMYEQNIILVQCKLLLCNLLSAHCTESFYWTLETRSIKVYRFMSKGLCMHKTGCVQSKLTYEPLWKYCLLWYISGIGKHALI